MTLEIVERDAAKAFFDDLRTRLLAAVPIGVNRTPIDLLLLEREGEIIVGGAYGFLHPGWIYIDMLWVEEGKRLQGLGSRLLKALEAEAIWRGAHSAYLWTQDFEAPQFYKKHGYQPFVALEEFIPRHSRIGMQKRLIPV